MLFCRKCGRDLPRDAFWNDRTRKTGKQANCRECKEAYTARIKLADPERIRNYKKKFNEANRARLNQEGFFYRYGITYEERDAMLSRQGGVCLVCESSEGPWHVDHDHACCSDNKGRTCGKCIRGILCAKCNKALGLLKDDPRIMRKAAEYVESSRKIDA